MFLAGLGVLLLAAGLVLVLLLDRRGEASGPVDQSRPGPILLVPGYRGSVTSLESLAVSLRATGRNVTIVTLPDQALGDLSEQATSLAAAARAVLDRTNAGSVDVVGYSAGGVVARLWVSEGGGASSVRRLVTLGSPHHGTELAELGALGQGTCPVACQQLSPSSPLLSRLDGEGLPAGPEYLSLWTTRDDVVVPPSSAVIEGVASPSVQSVCPESQVRHGALPSDPLVQRLVAQALASSPIPTWGPADCTTLTS
jgi:triacylglycerol lipase